MAARDVNVDRFAELVSSEFFEAHRGVLRFEDRDLLVFGNDGYSQDERTRKEVESVEAALIGHGFLVKGFGLDRKEGYSWALLVTPPMSEDADELDKDFAAIEAREVAEELLWKAHGYPHSYQRGIADQVLNKVNIPRAE